MDDQLKHAPCGFVSIDDEGEIVSVNETFVKIVGGEEDAAFLGRRLDSFFTIASRIFYQTHLFPLLKLHGKAEEIFITLRSVSGQDIPVILNAARHQRTGPWLNEFVFLVVRERQKYEAEILAAKRAAEEAVRSNKQLIETQQELEGHARQLDREVTRLEQRNRELRRLSQVLYHDLREPVRKLFSFLELLRAESPPTPGTAVEFGLTRLEAAARRIDNLLRIVREYLLIDSNGGSLELVDLRKTLDRAAQRAKAAHSAPLNCELEGLPVLEGDPDQLEMLFFHLLDNTLKFRRPEVEPHVTIRAVDVKQNQFVALKGHYEYADFSRISYRDNSLGFEVVNPEAPFQLLNKATPSGSGLSMGLAICRKVAENHNGSISLDTRRGNGVEYTILLPLRQKLGPLQPRLENDIIQKQ